jgi:hypothetical protein
MDNQNNGDLAGKVVSDLSKDFKIVGTHRVHSWYAWAIIGIVFGMALGIVYVANRSGRFNAGQANEALPNRFFIDEPSDHRMECSFLREQGASAYAVAQCNQPQGSISGTIPRWYRTDPHPPSDHSAQRSATWPDYHAIGISSFWPQAHTTETSFYWPPDHYAEQSGKWPSLHDYFFSWTWKDDDWTKGWPPDHDSSNSRTWPGEGTEGWPANHQGDVSNNGQ